MATQTDEVLRQRKSAIHLILMFGLVSLFGDIIYEGARSVNGPYLKTIGANAALVGLVAGIGEFLGYAIRLVSGYFADKTKAYWIFTFIGYGMLITVPLMSLTGIWQMVAVYIVLERIGKAIRSPAKDTIVSQASKQVGTGFGFGLQEAMDQIGATVGPLIFTVLFVWLGRGNKTVADYQKGYGLLWLPFLLLMACVIIAYLRVPDPSKLEVALNKPREPDKLSTVFWLYTLFSFVATLGFVNFVLIGYHLKAQNVLPDAQIPFFYAVAMAIDGVVALLIGKGYDILKTRMKNEKAGLFTLIVIPVFSILIPVLGFTTNAAFAITAVLLWGVVMGAHETIMKSAIADLTPLKKRGTGYGIFNTSYGLAMFFGSAAMGFLYDVSRPSLIVVSVALELMAIPLFFMVKNSAGKI
ncbi:MAG TPA: MFS transporter [Candidatus Omnitrophota bacterium]|nr:MFS transporter [Candidatus Omnitrophota bacterium]HRZ14401.1 MFS transporter [Candidatus Omnitrophota bacterium]